ncbi:hypothetical protein N0V90_001010 [Kalmusia sp. IMI 367209]|nr:hypothetical protein N0V90_001010 [Kalmusia sp. IMI 367209]
MPYSRRISLLSDAHFPQSIELYDKEAKIQLIQTLYERYSHMWLSYSFDGTKRPFAIRALEQRLIRTLQTVGEYGVLDCYLHQCLLWQRSGDSLTRIAISSSRDRIPSWSWMTYEGGIKYMDVSFDKVLWNTDLMSPFTSAVLDAPKESKEEQLPLYILTRIKKIGKSQDDKDIRMILDEPSRKFTAPIECVIIGSRKESNPEEETWLHYVLLVTQVSEDVTDVYERTCAITTFPFAIVGSIHGVSRHAYYLDLEDIIIAVKMLVVGEFFLLLELMFVKLQFTPVKGNWDPIVPGGKFTDLKKFMDKIYVLSTITNFTDFLCALTPLPITSRLNLRAKTKLGIM